MSIFGGRRRHLGAEQQANSPVDEIVDDSYIAAGRQGFVYAVQDRVYAEYSIPDMTDQRGCTTASAAFIHNALTGTTDVTPAYLDDIIGRAPHTAGDVTRLNYWFLEQGFYLEGYPPDDSGSPALAYIHGEIPFVEYLEWYQSVYGVVSDGGAVKRLYDYTETVVKPAMLGNELKLAPFKQTGQCIDMPEAPSPTALASMVHRGLYVMASMRSDQGSSHILTIFKPEPDAPAVVFNPVFPDINNRGGSEVHTLSRFVLDRVYFSEPIVGIGHWTVTLRR